jgi:hypothetical protein
MRALSVALVLLPLFAGGCAATKAELAAEAAWQAQEDAENERVGASFMRGYAARGRPTLDCVYCGGPNPYSERSSSSGGASGLGALFQFGLHLLAAALR